MKVRPDTTATIAILSFLGLAAAFVSTLVPPLLTARGSPMFVGSSLGLGPWDIFGAMISVYFWAFAGIRSVTKAIGLVVASTFAYFVAYFSGVFAGMFLSSAMGSQINTESAELGVGMVAPLLIAGVIGAFLVTVAVLRLYSEYTWPDVLKKALPWSLAGGVFALLGWGLGPSLGDAIWSRLYSAGLSDSSREMLAHDALPLNFNSLHIVWQIGMGATLGVVLSNTQLLSSTTRVQPEGERKLRPSNAFLFAVMAVFLAWFVIAELPTDYQNMRWQRAFAKHVAETPSSDNLPQIQPAPADETLILTPFGEYLPEQASAGQGHFVPMSGPQPQIYSVRYSRAGAPNGGPNVGPHVDVHVQEWPTADWARWELEQQNYSTTMNGANQSVNFGNRIVCTPGSKSCAWSSSNRLVIMEFSSVEPDEFLKGYLEKYPSTL
jgi:hypothetical protein